MIDPGQFAPYLIISFIMWLGILGYVFRRSTNVFAPLPYLTIHFFAFFSLAPVLVYYVFGMDFYFARSSYTTLSGGIYAIVYSFFCFIASAFGLYLGNGSLNFRLTVSPIHISHAQFIISISIVLVLVNILLGAIHYWSLGGFSGARILNQLYGRGGTAEDLGFILNGMMATLAGFILIVFLCHRKWLYPLTILFSLLIIVEFGVGLSRARAIFFGMMPVIACYMRIQLESPNKASLFSAFLSTKTYIVAGAFLAALVVISRFRGFFEDENTFIIFIEHILSVYLNRFEELTLSIVLYEKGILDHWTYFSGFDPVRRHIPGVDILLPSGGAFTSASTIFDSLAFTTYLHGKFTATIVTESYYNFKDFGMFVFILFGAVIGRFYRNGQRSPEHLCALVIVLGWLPYAFIANSNASFKLLAMLGAPYAIYFCRKLIARVR